MDNQQFPYQPQSNEPHDEGTQQEPSPENATPDQPAYYSEQPTGDDALQAHNQTPEQHPPYDAVSLQDDYQEGLQNGASASPTSPQPNPNDQPADIGQYPPRQNGPEPQVGVDGQPYHPPENQYVQLRPPSAQLQPDANTPSQPAEPPPEPNGGQDASAGGDAENLAQPAVENGFPAQPQGTMPPAPESQGSDQPYAPPQTPEPQQTYQSPAYENTEPDVSTSASQPPANEQPVDSQPPVETNQTPAVSDAPPETPPEQNTQQQYVQAVEQSSLQQPPVAADGQYSDGQHSPQYNESPEPNTSGAPEVNTASPPHPDAQPASNESAAGTEPVQGSSAEAQTYSAPEGQPLTSAEQPPQPASPDGTQLQPPFTPDSPSDHAQQAPPQPAPQQSGSSDRQTAPEQSNAYANTTFQLPNAQSETGNEGNTHLEEQISPPAEQTETDDHRPGWKRAIGLKAAALGGLLKRINFKSAVSAAVIGIVIFGIFNAQVILGQVQYLTTPSGGVQAPPGEINTDVPVGDEPSIIIPKINVNVPVVYDEPSFEEEKVQQALERGVVHYGTTAFPGEKGNTVIVGHSSNNWWDSGKYKFAFILLDRLQENDEIVLHYEGTRYVYEVANKKVVEPTNTSVLDQTEEPQLTLITCTPPGTSWQRLIVQAEQVTPDPSQNTDPDSTASQGAQSLPSDSGESFFDFLGDLF